MTAAAPVLAGTCVVYTVALVGGVGEPENVMYLVFREAVAAFLPALEYPVRMPASMAGHRASIVAARAVRL